MNKDLKHLTYPELFRLASMAVRMSCEAPKTRGKYADKAGVKWRSMEELRELFRIFEIEEYVAERRAKKGGE